MVKLLYIYKELIDQNLKYNAMKTIIFTTALFFATSMLFAQASYTEKNDTPPVKTSNRDSASVVRKVENTNAEIQKKEHSTDVKTNETPSTTPAVRKSKPKVRSGMYSIENEK